MHLVGSYYTNLSRCTVLRMSDSSYIVFITNLERTLYTIRPKSSVLPKCSKMSAETYKICDTCRLSILSQALSLFYIRRVTSRLHCARHIPFVIYRTFYLVEFFKDEMAQCLAIDFFIKEIFITADE